MRYAMVENVLIFVIHSFLATTVGIAVADTSQRLERMSAVFLRSVDRRRPEKNTPHMPDDFKKRRNVPELLNLVWRSGNTKKRQRPELSRTVYFSSRRR